MTPEGHNDLIPAIEAALQQATEPLDCNQLFDMPEIRAVAPSANRVSDYLGVLFRRGKVTRLPSPRDDDNNRARWKYVWRGKPAPAWRKNGEPVEPIEYRPKAILDKPNLYISDTGDMIQIEMPELVIMIKKKS